MIKNERNKYVCVTVPGWLVYYLRARFCSLCYSVLGVRCESSLLDVVPVLFFVLVRCFSLLYLADLLCLCFIER